MYETKLFDTEFVRKGDIDHLPGLFRRRAGRVINGFFPAVVLMVITIGVDKAFGIYDSMHGHHDH